MSATTLPADARSACITEVTPAAIRPQGCSSGARSTANHSDMLSTPFSHLAGFFSVRAVRARRLRQ